MLLGYAKIEDDQIVIYVPPNPRLSTNIIMGQIGFALGKTLPLNVDILFVNDLPEEPDSCIPLSTDDDEIDETDEILSEGTKGWFHIIKGIVRRYHIIYAQDYYYEISENVLDNPMDVSKPDPPSSERSVAT